MRTNDWENPLSRHDYTRRRFRARRDSRWGKRHNAAPYNSGNCPNSPFSNQTHQPSAEQHFNIESPNSFPRKLDYAKKNPLPDNST